MLAGNLSRLRRQNGVTLTELLIAVAVAAVLLVIALPSFTVWIQNTQIRTATEAMQNGLQLARAEAVRRNERVRFVLGAGTGWTVSTDSGTQLQARPNGEGSKNVTAAVTPSGATTVTFNALGRVVANGDGTAPITQLVLDVPASIIPADKSQELRVVVDSGGQIRTCDPSVTAADDPRKC